MVNSLNCHGVRALADSVRRHSLRVVVDSQPGKAAGTRIASRCSTARSQTVWETSAASLGESRKLRQTDQTSGAYRSMMEFQAAWLPSLASTISASMGLGWECTTDQLLTELVRWTTRGPGERGLRHDRRRWPMRSRAQSETGNRGGKRPSLLRSSCSIRNRVGAFATRPTDRPIGSLIHHLTNRFFPRDVRLEHGPPGVTSSIEMRRRRLSTATEVRSATPISPARPGMADLVAVVHPRLGRLPQGDRSARGFRSNLHRGDLWH